MRASQITTMRIGYEQAVYGSFPFRNQGYALLAQSPGCRPEWLDALKTTCQRLGQPPPGTVAGGLCATQLAGGAWAIIGISDQGLDDHGRPGALAFHALFLANRDYQRLGANPFRLADRLRADWGPETTTLPAVTIEIDDQPPPPPHLPQPVARVVATLRRGRKVTLAADGPIDDLARAIWQALPLRVRRRATVATWAFAHNLDFDLLARPRLPGEPINSPRDEPLPSTQPRLTWLQRPWTWWIVAGLLTLAALLTWRLSHFALTTPAPTSSPSPPPARPTHAAPIDSVEQARVVAGLNTLADRFGVEPDPDPATLMKRLDRRLRYRGPWLTDAQRADLADQAEADPDARRALEWEAHLRHFAPDRPLPADFDPGPLRWQLDVLAWSFHVEPDPNRPPAEVPLQLTDALAVEVPTRTSPLADRYPALQAYSRFLGRLPRR